MTTSLFRPWRQPGEAPHPFASRRDWLRWTGLAWLAAVLPAGCAPRPPGAQPPTDPIARFPEKIAMRVVNDRPPCLETPWRYFREDLTPNEAFFVRWHLEVIPTDVDLRTWRLKVGGAVDHPLELSMDELRRMEPASVVAVNQCSGNSRSLFAPRVAGGQWLNGAMGNARWTGIPLRDLLRRASVQKGAAQVTFQGLDRGPLPSVPDFVKALDVDHALEPEPLIAYEMNGAPLPLLNGFPIRLVVPGWYATYWVKSLAEITVVPQPYTGFWMAKAYQIPVAPNGVEAPDDLAKQTVPINRMNVRSFFTSPDAGAVVAAGRPAALEGIAFDGGRGVSRVEVSADSGATWQAAELGDDLGRFSFRRWRLAWTPPGRGAFRLQVRAVNRDNETQPAAAGWNRGGYMRNVVEEWPLTVG